MSKKIAIIGNTGHGTSVAAKAKNTLVAVDGDGKALAINGVRYTPIKRHAPGKALSNLMMMASMFGGLPGIKEPERPDVDIPTEFALIQRKQSNLSRSQRDWVEDVFHANFKKL